MIGCACEHVATSREARREVRRNPHAHVHTGVSRHQIAKLVRHVYKQGEPAYAFGVHRVYIAHGFVIEVCLYHDLGSRPSPYTLIPIGLPTYLANDRPQVAYTPADPYALMRTHVDETVVSLISLPIRATPARMSRYTTIPHTTFNRPMRTRTCVWVMPWTQTAMGTAGVTDIVDLTGVIPPIRHEFGSFERVHDVRYSIVYATRTRAITRMRVRRRRMRPIIHWNEVNRVCSRLRVHELFTVNEYGIMHTDGQRALF